LPWLAASSGSREGGKRKDFWLAAAGAAAAEPARTGQGSSRKPLEHADASREHADASRKHAAVAAAGGGDILNLLRQG
jgi:hypothetical protein